MAQVPASPLKNAAKNFSDREFSMSDSDFAFIKNLAKEKTGIELGDHKKEMIYSRIVRRIRSLNLRSFKEYCQYLKTHQSAELTPFINVITTNLTAFFREQHHFDFLKNNALPDILATNAKHKRLRIWSAGCSTGEEPYSLAMTLHEVLAKQSGWDAKILATDLDSNVIRHARTGVYGHDRCEDLSKAMLNSYFIRMASGSTLTATGKIVDTQQTCYQISDEIKRYIQFNHLNLLSEKWPMKGKFDVIFCRNVVIYFSKDTQRSLFDRYADLLNPSGYLFIGHSENLNGVSTRFKSLGNTVYQKKV